MTREEYMRISNDYTYGIYIGACNGCPYTNTKVCNECKYSSLKYIRAQKEYYYGNKDESQ